MKQFSAAVVLLLVTGGLAILAGCEGPARVVEPLPPPIIQAPAPTPLVPLPAPPSYTGPQIRGAVVVIDAGHGGKDPGALPKFSGQLPEKTIVLDLAGRIATALRERGARVVMTRSSDTFLELQQRADIAGRNRADLFISIHANAVERTHISGVEVHIHTRASSQSQKAALRMASALERAGVECRGIIRNNFHVLREHSRPAMLIESGYLTNRGDAQKLNSPTWRARLSAAIADGVTAYFTP
ncbi:MAG TPA: N-acetylmuramoyl-L-alanine amidase [Phycisphaerae bacterium]|nr:N-acetylmuramoyl-L-alanine amidase [Phycisphaerae bacterium]